MLLLPLAAVFRRVIVVLCLLLLVLVLVVVRRSAALPLEMQARGHRVLHGVASDWLQLFLVQCAELLGDGERLGRCGRRRRLVRIVGVSLAARGVTILALQAPVTGFHVQAAAVLDGLVLLRQL